MRSFWFCLLKSFTRRPPALRGWILLCRGSGAHARRGRFLQVGPRVGGASFHFDADRLGPRFLLFGQDDFQDAVLLRGAYHRLIDVRWQAERPHEGTVGTLCAVQVLRPHISGTLPLPPEDEGTVLQPKLDVVLLDPGEIGA